MKAMYAYKDYAVSSSLKSPRDSESDVILSVTRKLREADALRDTDYAAFVASIHLNRKLWSLLSTDVSHENNALPDEIKDRIRYLGEFVQQYSSKVLTEKSSVAPLIDINLAVLRGLGGQRSTP